MTIFLKRFLIVILLLLIQFSFLPYLRLNYYLDLLLVIFFLWALGNNGGSKLYLLVFCGGMLFDLFSGYPLGTNTFFYLSFVFFLESLSKNFLGLSKIPLFFLVSFLSIAIFIIIKTVILRGLGIDSFLNTFWWQQILANTLLIDLIGLFSKKSKYER